MATLREFILAQSSLPAGNTIRDHVENPLDCSGSVGVVLFDGLEILMDERCVEVEIDLDSQDLTDDTLELEVRIGDFDYDVELC